MDEYSNTDCTEPSLWFGNTLVSVRQSSQQGADGICVLEQWLPYGDSPPLHVHRTEDEIFHVLEGVVRFRVDGQERMAVGGDTVIAPKNRPHTFRIESPEGARLLNITCGGDFEALVRAVSQPAPREELPARAEPSEEEIARLTRLCAENGIDIIGAPMAARA